MTLPNDCLCQIVGEPLVHIRLRDGVPVMPERLTSGVSRAHAPQLKRKATGDNELDKRPFKRVKSNDGTSRNNSMKALELSRVQT